jgi:hypothetical protein
MITKADNPVTFRVNGAIVTNYDDLQPKQQLLYNTVCNHYTDTLNPPQLLLHVDREGGIGKMTVVLAIYH